MFLPVCLPSGSSLCIMLSLAWIENDITLIFYGKSYFKHFKDGFTKTNWIYWWICWIFSWFTLRISAVHNVWARGWLVAVFRSVFHRWIHLCISSRAIKINKSLSFTTLMSDSFCTTYAQVHKRDTSKNSLIWCWSAGSEWKRGVVGRVMLFSSALWSLTEAYQNQELYSSLPLYGWLCSYALKSFLSWRRGYYNSYLYQYKITMWLPLVLYCNTDIYDVNNVARVQVYEKHNLHTSCVLMSR